MQGNNIDISTLPGPFARVRRALQRYLGLLNANASSQVRSNLEHLGRPMRARLLRWLNENVPREMLTDKVRHLERMIREQMKQAYATRPTTRTFDDFIKVVHMHEIARSTRVRQILKEPAVANLHPDPRRASQVRICDKMVPPVSLKLCNFTEVSLGVTSNTPMPESNTCACRALLPMCTDLVDGHIVTVDYNSIPNSDLRHLFLQGSKYRLNYSSHDVIPSLRLGLREYIAKYINTLRKRNAQMDTTEIEAKLSMWQEEIIRRCKQNLALRTGSYQSHDQRYSRAALKEMRDNFAILPVDKTSHNLAVCCKKWYLHKLSQELDSPIYTPATESAGDILGRHAQWNRRWAYSHRDNLPYLYLVLKAHKNPPQLRGIAGVTRRNAQQPPVLPDTQNQTILQTLHKKRQEKPIVSTTPASRVLSTALQGVIKTLQEKDENTFETTGARRCWITKGAEQVVSNIKANASSLQHCVPKTSDFTTMYTNLPHDRIKENVKQAVKEAHDFKMQQSTEATSQLYMKISGKDTGTWTRQRGPGTLTINEIQQHVDFIVDNTYLKCSDGTIRHQKIGIPMGTNASPELANLTLYWDEAKYIDHLLDTDERMAEKHAFTSRFIDDVLTWDCLPPSPSLYGLQWRETTNSDGSCTFLGAKIQIQENGQLRLSIFDKAAEWGFHVIRYPSASSNTPAHQPAGVFSGQLARFKYICNNTRDFKLATTQLTLRMFQRGHSYTAMLKGWRAHLRSYYNINPKRLHRLSKWFRSMLRWASHR
jgi:hypothetical protein